ncbi:hypothetical protein PCL1606_00280 [Pseudomonas chlororaphis]|uniref:Uncharacterized protein n=1 Tax=Pseudomonas chlororaphis TaxID=587753 RepID=A0A0D5XRL4_9PSED|nr:hypothetical protein PCL1606_00280 [Pseudomonas chlororaphis]
MVMMVMPVMVMATVAVIVAGVILMIVGMGLAQWTAPG